MRTCDKKPGQRWRYSGSGERGQQSTSTTCCDATSNAAHRKKVRRRHHTLQNAWHVSMRPVAAGNRHATPIRCGDRQVTHSGVGSPGCFSCSHGCAAASRRGLPCSARSCSWAQSAWAPFARASWSLPFAAPSRMGARSRRGRR